jgi:small subunit ribosomal protein S16
MLKIRMSRGGAKRRPFYKIVIADSRRPRDGKFIEKVGYFNPLLPKDKKERLSFDVERIKYWLDKGAKPSFRIARFLGEAKIIPMPEKRNNPLKAKPKKKAQERLKAAEEAKKAPEAPKTQAKKEEPKKADAPKTQAKKEEPQKADAPKTEAKKEEPKKEVKKDEDKKK